MQWTISSLLATLLLGSIGLPPSTEASRILGLFPHHGESHFVFFEPILRALDEAGHEVHIVSHFELKNVSSRFQNIIVQKPGSSNNAVDLAPFQNRVSFIHFLEFFMLRGWAHENCEMTMTTPAVKKLIKNPPKYDLILMEMFNSDCMFGIAHRINAPVIGLSSCAMMPWHYDRMGNPQTPSLTPSLFMGYSDRMNLKQRLGNWIGHFGMKALYYLFSDTDSNALIRKHIGPDVPDVRELVKDTSMYFLNQHYSLSGAKPLVPSVIELGGIHIKEQQPLDEDLEEFISSAKDGVILISWGSMVKSHTMPREKMDAIVSALKELKQKIIWKWEGDIPNKPGNVLLKKWLPQRDILCHPNVRAFWTHGGLGGSSEAALCGTPVVATPIYGDQFLNSAAFENRGAGKVLSYEEISKERVLEALNFALKPSTTEAAKRISYSYARRPMSPSESAVYWAEHTISTGGQSLMKPASTHISWFIYYGFDVYTVIISAILAIVFSWMWVVRMVCGQKKTPQRKVKKN